MKIIFSLLSLFICQIMFCQIDTLYHTTLSKYSHNSSNYASKKYPAQFVKHKENLIIYTQDNKLVKLDKFGKIIFLNDSLPINRNTHGYIAVNSSSDIFLNTSKEILHFSTDGEFMNSYKLEIDHQKRYNLNIATLGKSKILLAGTNHYIYPHKGSYQTTVFNIKTGEKVLKKIKSKKWGSLKLPDWNLNSFNPYKDTFLFGFYNSETHESILIMLDKNQEIIEEKELPGKIKDLIRDDNSINVLREDFDTYFPLAIVSLTNSLKIKKNTIHFSLPYNTTYSTQEYSYFKENTKKSARFRMKNYDGRDYQINGIFKTKLDEVYIYGSANKSPFIYSPDHDRSLTINTIQDISNSREYSEINQIQRFNEFYITAGITEKWMDFEFNVGVELFIEKIKLE